MTEPKPDPTVSLEHPLVLGLPGTWQYDQDHGGWGRQEPWLPSDGVPEPENDSREWTLDVLLGEES